MPMGPGNRPLFHGGNMSEDKTWVQAVIDPKLYPNMPGSVIRLWGFDFKIYTDKSLCLEMPNDFVKHEVKAGHVKVMDSLPPGIVEVDMDIPDHKKVNVKIEDPQFTKSVKNYYGYGNMNAFIENISKLTVPKIKSFAKSRFDVTFPINIKKEDLLDELRSLTDLAIISEEAEEEEE